MSADLVPIQTALISVTDKSGLSDFVKQLLDINPDMTLIASGGTAKALQEHGISYIDLSEYTQFPECFGGRVKTLHPSIAGGILMRRGQDESEAENLGIRPIDLVVCNLYDFENAAKDQNAPIESLIESMDIGGCTLIRSAAKNFVSVSIVTNPKDYESIISEMKKNQGKIGLHTRKQLAVKAVNLTADYEAMLAKEFTRRITGEETERQHLVKGKQLRYGENPDQSAWVFNFPEQNGIAQAKCLSGKELSYNNYEDATAAYNAAQELLNFGCEIGCAIIKHGSLCAYATGSSAESAFEQAWAGDPKSSFGSVIAFTTEVNEELASHLQGKFLEVIIAPSYTKGFVEWTKEKKPNLRLLEVPNKCQSEFLFKNISGGLLRQTRKQKLFSTSVDELLLPKKEGEKIGVVTKKIPEKDLGDLFAFGVAAVSYAKSNAVAIVRKTKNGGCQLLGMGAGQPNRVDSLQRLAIPKAIENLREEHKDEPGYDPKVDLAKCVIASDGFFPFDDSIRYAAEFGFQYCIQPGGSKQDPDVIAAADELGMCMIFTGSRYFSH